MAPTDAKTNDSNMKQKSLMSFFGKPTAVKSVSGQKAFTSPSSGKSSSALNASKAPKSSPPESKNSDTLAPSSSAGISQKSSGGGSSVKQTPPTSSDPIDVDMLSAEEGENERVQAKAVSKIVLLLLLYSYLCDLEDSCQT